MLACINRDKLTARHVKREVILQQLTLLPKVRKKPHETLLEKIQSNDNIIETLELELTQQQLECNWLSRVLEEKRSTIKFSFEMAATPMIGTNGSFGSSGIESSTSENKDSCGRNVESGCGTSRMNTNDDADGDDCTLPANAPIITTCMECNLMPTNHTCLKCMQVWVCSVCCNAPWCKTCFENETPASQAMIRNGNYNFRLKYNTTRDGAISESAWRLSAIHHGGKSASTQRFEVLFESSYGYRPGCYPSFGI